MGGREGGFGRSVSENIPPKVEPSGHTAADRRGTPPTPTRRRRSQPCRQRRRRDRRRRFWLRLTRQPLSSVCPSRPCHRVTARQHNLPHHHHPPPTAASPPALYSTARAPQPHTATPLRPLNSSLPLSLPPPVSPSPRLSIRALRAWRRPVLLFELGPPRPPPSSYQP